MNKPKSDQQILVVCRTWDEFLAWRKAEPQHGNVIWIRSARMLTVHSGTGAKVFWLDGADKRPDYADIRSTYNVGHFDH